MGTTFQVSDRVEIRPLPQDDSHRGILLDIFGYDRRAFLSRTAGAAALATLLGNDSPAESTHFPAKAKRIIYLFQSGAPSQIDLFDHKPKLQGLFAKDLPDSVRMGQRLTGMTATQDSFPV